MVQEFSLRSSSELGGMERRLDDYRESSLGTSSIEHKAEKGALRDTIPVSENLQPLTTTAENCARACTAGSGAAPHSPCDPNIFEFSSPLILKGCDMFSMSPHAEQSGCQAVFHAGLKEFPWPLYAEKSADRDARGDSAIWVRDCAAASENILPGYDGVKMTED